MKEKSSNKIVALKVRQWIKEWDKVTFDKKEHRGKPEPEFFMFTMPASKLKALSGIHRRTTSGGILRSEDLGIQRRHDENRSKEIADYFKFGYPWSELSNSKRESGDFEGLRKPGWLPTAIVVNILKPEDKRGDKKVFKEDLILIDKSEENFAQIELPKSFIGSKWKPRELNPIEVIDGQHRLWAFENEEKLGDENYELPVVAFYGLDISWQAYLFWTINIKPKRINASLAFDLYPLLRTEDWLEKFEGHSIYRETRAQELVEVIWSHPSSPWYQRINMLGESGLNPMVSQAAWIRSLMATYVKSWDGKNKIGGLFGTKLKNTNEALGWSRAQQGAFLILMGIKVKESIAKSKEVWATKLRNYKQSEIFEKNDDLAFIGSYTLLNTDQGIRSLLAVTNDLCYMHASELELHKWIQEDLNSTNEEAILKALNSLKKQKVEIFLESIAIGLSDYDWRTSSAPDLEDSLKNLKLAFRGSGGYSFLRVQLLKHLAGKKGEIGLVAKSVLKSAK